MSSFQNDFNLAKKAAAGDSVARDAVSRMAHPLIINLTKAFCKRYCYDNHAHAQCTLFLGWGMQDRDAPLCDWGNHSYAWMLEDLTGTRRLLAYSGENNARLTTYFHAIANSLPFYERWKDWRFDRRIRVPEFIQKISPLAGKIFLGMIANHPLDSIAQQVRDSKKNIEMIADRIIAELTSRGKLNLLNQPKTISLTGMGRSDDEDEEDEDIEGDIPDHSWDPGENQGREMISKGWNRLTAVEQFVLEAIVIEEREASDILAALVKTGIRIKEDVPPEKIDRQQLYYFKRVTLARLARLSGVIQ